MVAGLREKMGAVQRASWRKAHALKVAELPVEEAYRATVADIAAVFSGREPLQPEDDEAVGDCCTQCAQNQRGKDKQDL